MLIANRLGDLDAPMKKRESLADVATRVENARSISERVEQTRSEPIGRTDGLLLGRLLLGKIELTTTDVNDDLPAQGSLESPGETGLAASRFGLLVEVERIRELAEGELQARS